MVQKMLIPGLEIDLASSKPVYRQIAEAVRQAALEGLLEGGHRLPPTRDLARQLGVNRNTVVAAYEALATEGWIRSHTGKGTFLLARGDATSAPERPEADSWVTGFSRAVEAAAAGDLQSIYSLALSGEGISFVGSYPTGDLLPVEAFGRALTEALGEGGPDILSYGPTAGHGPLRETIAEGRRRDGSSITPEQILVTNGAQQAIELVFRSFLERGDSVLIEEPTYTGALNVLSCLGARAIAVPTDGEGMRPDLLAVALERHRPRLMYVQPTFHNPTTAVMGEARRREVLALAQRHRCLVVEDDWGGDLRFEGDPLPSLHALDGGKHVIYLSTFSKKLMPGLRIGWVAAPPVVLERLVDLKRIQDCGTSPLLQAALDVFLRRGGLTEHLERVRPAYRSHCDRMIRALEKQLPPQAEWTRPEGGLFLWVTLPVDIDGNELFVAARRRGVLYSRGELFHSEGSGRSQLRLTYSAASLSEIDAGVETLGALIRERWPDRAEPDRRGAAEAMPIF